MLGTPGVWVDDLATIAARHEHGAEPAWVWDADRRRVLWGNAAALALFGAASIFDLIEHIFAPDAPEALAAMRAGDCIEANLAPGGAPMRARLDVANLILPHADNARFVLVRAIEAAHADPSLARRAALFQFAPSAMALADLDGRIVEANAATAIIVGKVPANVAAILGDGQAKNLIASALAAGHATASAEHNRRILRASALRVADPVDGGARVLIRIDDITARRDIEALYQTRAAQTETAPPPIVAPPASETLDAALAEAERKSAAKSEFIATLSHEMRNPLNAIIGFAEIMQRKHFGPLGDRRYEAYAEDIRASADHLLSLVDDLLDLARIESGKLNLAPKRVALAPLIEECTRALHPAAQGYGVTLTAEVGALPQVVADARSLKQVLFNLISNGLKFTGAGGQVRVTAAANTAGALVIAVADTGVGMSAADVAHALEPFGQVEGALQNKRKGTGLGLPLAKALAEANRLTFEIASEPGRGTVVRLTFPPALIAAANGANPPPPAPANAATAPQTPANSDRPNARFTTLT